MTAFFMSWQMFLWIPCPVRKWDDSKRIEMLLCMPFVGIVAGLCWWGLFLLFSLLRPDIPPFLCVVLAVFPWCVTGFMHIDGFMDCSDASLYFGSRDKKLAILKDSHAGTFAVICVVVLAVLQSSAMIQIGSLDLSAGESAVLIFIPALMRCLAVSKIFRWDALPASSYTGLRENVKRSHRAANVSMAVVFLAAVLLVCGVKILGCLCIGAIVQELGMVYLKKNLGGMSGDISGAAITTGELACLAALSFLR